MKLGVLLHFAQLLLSLCLGSSAVSTAHCDQKNNFLGCMPVLNCLPLSALPNETLEFLGHSCVLALPPSVTPFGSAS